MALIKFFFIFVSFFLLNKISLRIKICDKILVADFTGCSKFFFQYNSIGFFELIFLYCLRAVTWEDHYHVYIQKFIFSLTSIFKYNSLRLKRKNFPFRRLFFKTSFKVTTFFNRSHVFTFLLKIDSPFILREENKFPLENIVTGNEKGSCKFDQSFRSAIWLLTKNPNWEERLSAFP